MPILFFFSQSQVTKNQRAGILLKGDIDSSIQLDHCEINDNRGPGIMTNGLTKVNMYESKVNNNLGGSIMNSNEVIKKEISSSRMLVKEVKPSTHVTVN